MEFASWKERKPVAAALKTIYRALDAEAGRQALDEFAAGPWGVKYPAIAQSWRRNWEMVIPFFAFPLDVRRPIRGTEQHRARIRCDGAAVERRDHRASFDACKSKWIRTTLCRHRGPPAKLIKSFSQNNFLRFSAPMHLPGVRDPG
jgi:hypothetical protein